MEIDINNFKFTRELLVKYGNELINNMKNNLRLKDAIASGQLIDSIKFEVKKYNQIFKIELNMEEYWYYVNYGRKPGKFPPLDKIKIWITQQHIKSKIPINSLAFLIARKISKFGYKGNNFYGLALTKTNTKYKMLIGQALSKDLNNSIILEYKNTLK